MKMDELEFAFEDFRYKVALIEKYFIKKNRHKYKSYSDFESALNKKLKILLEEEKKKLVAEQVLFRVFRQRFE